MNITDYFLSKTKQLVLMPEVTNSAYQMFNSGSTEREVSEFLYGLVRLIKPTNVLETGTHYGVSSAYIAQAMKDNGHPGDGFVTLEAIASFKVLAEQLWGDLELQKYVRCQLTSSLEYGGHPEIGFKDGLDLLFLDSEPQIRFDEFVRYWTCMRPGSFILIHDLHSHLGHTGQTINGQFDWPYGDFRDKLGVFIKAHDVQTVSFPSPRGFTLFQKVGENFGANQLLKGFI